MSQFPVEQLVYFAISMHLISEFKYSCLKGLCQCSIHVQMIFSTSRNGMQTNLIIVTQKSYNENITQ